MAAEHLCGGVWLNSPPVSPTRASPSPAPSSGGLLGSYLQGVYHEDELRRSKVRPPAESSGEGGVQVPAAYWALRDIIQDENPGLSIANGPDIPGLDAILWLLDHGDRLLKCRWLCCWARGPDRSGSSVLQLLWAIWSDSELGELRRLVGDALNAAVEHGQEPTSGFDPESPEAKALQLCVSEEPTEVDGLLVSSGTELLFHWWLFGDEALQLAAARAISIAQGRSFDPLNSFHDHAMNLALQQESMQARVIPPNRHKFVRSSILPWLCAIFAEKTPAPPSAGPGAARAIAMIMGQSEFMPESSPVDKALLEEMLSMYHYGRPHRAIGDKVLEHTKRRCLVLGHSGDTGMSQLLAPVCHALRSHGHDVVCAAKFSSRETLCELRDAGVYCLPLDFGSGSVTMAAQLPEQVDLVFLLVFNPSHLAATQPDAPPVWKLNNNAVSDIVRRYAGKADIIHGSSASVYGYQPGNGLSSEADNPAPQSEYAKSMTAQEQLVDTVAAAVGNTRVVHLRFFNIDSIESGPVRVMAESVLRGESLGEFPDERMQVLALADAVRCTLLAPLCASSTPLTVNVCHPKVWTREQLANHIALELGSIRFGNKHCAGPSHRGLNSEERGIVQFNPLKNSEAVSLCGDAQTMIQCFGEPQESIVTLIREVCHDVVIEAAGF